MSLLKKFGSVTAIVAFLNSPTGQKMLGKAKEVVTDPQNRAKAVEFANKIRKPNKPAADQPPTAP